MAPKRTDEKLIDPHTLISKKYFSVVSRKNHNTDLFHDRANIFPEFSAFEKPCCSVAHVKHEDHSFPNNTVIKDIAKKYLPPVPSKISSGMGIRSQSVAPTSNSSGANLLQKKERRGSSTTKNSKKAKITQDGGAETPSNPRGSRANSIAKIERKASVVFQRPYKNIVEGGQIMLEKSRQIIEEMATPVELIERIRSQKRAESTHLKTDKEKIEKLAKRLDLSMKAHDHDDTKKVYSFLAQIPMDYYRKARDLKTAGRASSRRDSQVNKTLEESSPLSAGFGRGRRVRRRLAVPAVGESTPKEEEQQPEQDKSGATLSPIHHEDESTKRIETEMSPLRIPHERSFDIRALNKDERISGSGIARRERKLFLSGLSGMATFLKRGGMWQEEKLSSLFSAKGPKLERSRTRASDILSIHLEGQERLNMEGTERRTAMPSSKRSYSREDKEAWIEKVKEIKQGINSYLVEDKSFLDVYQDEVNTRVKDFDMSTLEKEETEEGDDQDFEGDYEKEDQDKIIYEAKNREPEVYAILKQTLKGKGGSSAKNEANRETLNFYKKIAMKEKRKADGMMVGPKTEKKNNTSKNAGRDIFNVPAN